jgi:hypothetical protein
MPSVRPEQAVASAYDLAERLLANQRKFAEDLVKATAPLMPGFGVSKPENHSQGENAPEARDETPARQETAAASTPQETAAGNAPKATAPKSTTKATPAKRTPKSTAAASRAPKNSDAG